uniref:C2H2-type domain-containing protein n=1 Tax=Anopheles quadriannulatus TaxID=34691 RepID=A0A182WT42_ANOQN
MYRNYLCRVCACTETTSVLVNIFEKHGAQDSVADILLELADIKLFANMKYYEIHKNKMHGDQAARKRYICSICGAKVVSTSYLKVHMKLHSEDHPYSCDLCGARFKIVAYLNWHMTRHKGIYTCQQCGLTCKGPSELNEHMNSHGEVRKYSCTICPSAFRLKQALEKHMRNVHKRKRKPLKMINSLIIAAHNATKISFKLNEQYDDNQFDNLSVASSDREDSTLGKCPFYHCCECATDFFDSDTLQNHYESMHANAVHGWESFGISEISLYDSTDDEVEDTPPKDNVPYEDKGIPHRCCGCKYLFDTETELQLHCETVHRPNAMKVDEDRPAQCNICYQTFTTACGMRVHQRAMRVLRYQCAVCGKLFGNRAACIIHETNHEDHQLSCDLCGKKFTNQKYLNIHKQNVHTDPETRKKYVCNVCGTSVTSASYLKAHMMLHSEDAPYACSLCEHRYKLLLYLNRHMKWHRGVYTCKQCGLRVKSASSLSNHMASHTGIQQYSCSICCSKYRYKESLKKHLRRKHGRSTRRKDRSE